MESCPCGSGQPFDDCCRPYLEGDRPAPTAEALMRSRYTAYVMSNIGYIEETTHASRRDQFNRKESEAWSRKAQWETLQIVHTENGGPQDEDGLVEFVVRFRDKGRMRQHNEVAEFKQEEGRWYFMDGKAPEQAQVIRPNPKVGRNDPCPCGSRKKFKKCCGA